MKIQNGIRKQRNLYTHGICTRFAQVSIGSYWAIIDRLAENRVNEKLKIIKH